MVLLGRAVICFHRLAVNTNHHCICLAANCDANFNDRVVSPQFGEKVVVGAEDGVPQSLSSPVMTCYPLPGLSLSF